MASEALEETLMTAGCSENFRALKTSGDFSRNSQYAFMPTKNAKAQSPNLIA